MKINDKINTKKTSVKDSEKKGEQKWESVKPYQVKIEDYKPDGYK